MTGTSSLNPELMAVTSGSTLVICGAIVIMMPGIRAFKVVMTVLMIEPHCFMSPDLDNVRKYIEFYSFQRFEVLYTYVRVRVRRMILRVRTMYE